MFNTKMKKNVSEIEARVDDHEMELAGYEDLFQTVFENFESINRKNESERETILDLIFALATAMKVKPDTLSRNMDQKKLSEYVKLFNVAQEKKKSKAIEAAIARVKSKHIDKKGK